MLGEILLEARQRAKIPSRMESARRLGISGEALRKIENGNIVPRNELLDRIIEVYELNSRLSQRLYRAAFEARLKNSKILQEQEDLRRNIQDPAATRLASQIASEIIIALRRYKQVSDRQMFQEVNAVVQRCLRDREGT